MSDKITTTKEIQEGATKTITSPFSGHTYKIRKSSGLDYLALDFLPHPDPTMPVEKRKKATEEAIDSDLGLQAQIQKALVSKCVLDPKLTDKGDPNKPPPDTTHVDLLGQDVDWLFVEIDDWTRGADSGNPTSASGD